MTSEVLSFLENPMDNSKEDELLTLILEYEDLIFQKAKEQWLQILLMHQLLDNNKDVVTWGTSSIWDKSDLKSLTVLMVNYISDVFWK